MEEVLNVLHVSRAICEHGSDRVQSDAYTDADERPRVGAPVDRFARQQRAPLRRIERIPFEQGCDPGPIRFGDLPTEEQSRLRALLLERDRPVDACTFIHVFGHFVAGEEHSRIAAPRYRSFVAR